MIELLTPFIGKILGLVTVILALVSAWFVAKKSGRAEAEVEAAKQRQADNEAIAVRQVNEARAAAETQNRTVENANETLNDVNAMSDAAVISELRNEYTRDDTATTGDNRPNSSK